MNLARWVASRQTLVIPAIACGWVLVVGGALLLIIGRSPYTHGNLVAAPAAGYTRTVQSTVGAAVPFTGMRAAAPSLVADSVARGQTLMVTAGCAACHGLTGGGGPVGPSIASADAKRLRTRTSNGIGGMPTYASGALSDDQLAAIAAYLASQAKPAAATGK